MAIPAGAGRYSEALDSRHIDISGGGLGAHASPIFGAYRCKISQEDKEDKTVSSLKASTRQNVFASPIVARASNLELQFPSPDGYLLCKRGIRFGYDVSADINLDKSRPWAV